MSDNPSSERFYYSSIFPSSSTVNPTNGVFLSFDELMRLLPDRIMLARVDDIFRSWCKEEEQLSPDKRFVCDQINFERTHILYKHDHNKYVSSAFGITFLNSQPQYCIKLANSDFIYPSAASLETDPTYNDSFFCIVDLRVGAVFLQRPCRPISRQSSSLPPSFSKGSLSTDKFCTMKSMNVLIFDSRPVTRPKTRCT